MQVQLVTMEVYKCISALHSLVHNLFASSKAHDICDNVCTSSRLQLTVFHFPILLFNMLKGGELLLVTVKLRVLVTLEPGILNV